MTEPVFARIRAWSVGLNCFFDFIADRFRHAREENPFSVRNIQHVAHHLILAFGFIASAAISASTAFAEWSSYRSDAFRSAATKEKLPDTMELLWRFQTHAPQPAWPAPAKRSLWQNLDSIDSRVTEDRVFHPVASEDAVFFGSTTDDHLNCLDLATGKVRWSFPAAGPIRFAPWVAGDLIYFGCDDGRVYCLTANTGEPTWIRHVAPLQAEVAAPPADLVGSGIAARLDPQTNGPLINGNGRLISAWPIRTGIVVQDSTLYVAAGLIPSQGTYVAAFDTATGDLRWRSALPEISPQGHLLLSRDRLFIPTGRSNPISVDRASGKEFKRYGGVGGSYAVLVDDLLFSGRGNDGRLVGNRQQTADQLIELRGRQMVISTEQAFLQTTNQLSAIDRKRQLRLTIDRSELQSRRKQVNTKLEAANESEGRLQDLASELMSIDQQLSENEADLEKCRLWQVTSELSEALLLAGDQLVTAGQGGVALRSCNDGRLLWRADVAGVAGGLAVHRQTLIVSTTDGEVLAFGHKPSQEPSAGLTHTSNSHATDDAGESAAESDKEVVPSLLKGWDEGSRTDAVTRVLETLREQVSLADGFCVILGIGDGELCRRAALETNFRIVAVDHDQHRIAQLRRVAAEQGIVSSKLSAIATHDGEIPITDYLAAAVIRHETHSQTWSAEAVRRVVRPFGGVTIDASASKSTDGHFPVTHRGPLPGAGRWGHLYGSPANTSTSNDAHIRKNLRLQWFGTLGPRQMIDRHLRGPAPLADEGRMYVFGDNVVITLDAYSGLRQWQLALPQSQRYSIPYDAGYAAAADGQLFLAVNHQMWRIDGNDGSVVNRVTNPGGETKHWGYLAEQQGWILGSVQRPNASRTVASRRGIDEDYRSGQGLVVSEAMFAMPVGQERAAWVHDEGSLLLNPTITADSQSIYFVQVRNPDNDSATSSRITLASLRHRQAELVCLRLRDGTVRWRARFDLTPFKNILYLAVAEGRLILSGSRDATDSRAGYRIEVRRAEDGAMQWSQEHLGRSGDLYHGEQVQHPVVLGDRIISEPYLFDLSSGQKVFPEGESGDWSFQRPGHSCGSITGAGDCLFFRADNPVCMHLGAVNSEADRFQKLAPSRTGCWINTIPAQGLVLIPEASAGCVCNYPLQTSMAFLPVDE